MRNKKDETSETEVTDSEWRKRLTPEQFRVTRQAGTERAFTGVYWDHFQEGHYVCVCCSTALFNSNQKFESHCGWPSFSSGVDGMGASSVDQESWVEALLVAEGPLEYREDRSHGMTRIEVLCRSCKAHLGHVFDDGPPPAGLRYCINSASLLFVGAK